MLTAAAFALLFPSPAPPTKVSDLERCVVPPMEFDKTYKERLTNVIHPDKWKETPRIDEIDNIRNILGQELTKHNYDVATTKEKTAWKKGFLPIAYQCLADFISDKNERWRKEYLDLVKDFNVAQLNQQAFNEISNTLMLNLQTFADMQRRLLSVEEVYLRNLEAIPTTYPAVGTQGLEA